MENTNEQHQIYEAARKRTKQKKRLAFHFVVFLIGSALMVIMNKYLSVYPDIDWFVWGIFIWLFFLLIHAGNVFFVNRFFGEEWERKHTEQLLDKHVKKLAKLEKKLEKKGAFDKVIDEIPDEDPEIR